MYYNQNHLQQCTCLVGEKVTGCEDFVAAKGVHGLHLERVDISGQCILLTLPCAALQ